jgi:hypothetical protein
MGTQLEPSVPAGVDPRRYALELARIREAVLSGVARPRREGVGPRPAIEDSWRRMLAQGVNPDRSPVSRYIRPDALEERRRHSMLRSVLPQLSQGLLDIADEASHIMLVVDVDGTVLWREGSTRIKMLADRIDLAEGVLWDENAQGTSGVGTGLELGRPMQVFSAEHFAKWLQGWTCSAAPVHDPRSGELIGVIDISGPASTVHASTLLLVDAVARLAHSALKSAHNAELDRLRASGAPILARLNGPGMVTDEHGWVAATQGLAPGERVLLPERLRAGQIWLPTLGRCEAVPVPGGWLVRPHGDDEEERSATEVELDLSKPKRAVLKVAGAGGSWSYPLSPRHAELLVLLAHHRAGRSAAQLATDLFGDVGKTVTVRAEMSRLRRRLGGVLDNQPYRFADGLRVSTVLPENLAALLPTSLAPTVRQMRERG